MGHGPCAFKQSDVVRAVRAAQAAGLKVTGFEITTDGKITVVASVENGTTTAAETCTVRQVNMTISLAFLAPNLVQAAVDGRLPRGIGIANLRDAPVEWSLQYARLGLAP